jgi:hypothetical protein
VRQPKVGTVVQIELPDGRVAYGRTLNDAAIAFYRQVGTPPCSPSLGSRDYLFIVGVQQGFWRAATRAGFDPAVSAEDDWPSPMRTGSGSRYGDGFGVYHHGMITPAADQDAAQRLEPTAAWDLQGIIEGIMEDASE